MEETATNGYILACGAHSLTPHPSPELPSELHFVGLHTQAWTPRPPSSLDYLLEIWWHKTAASWEQDPCCKVTIDANGSNYVAHETKGCLNLLDLFH